MMKPLIQEVLVKLAGANSQVITFTRFGILCAYKAGPACHSDVIESFSLVLAHIIVAVITMPHCIPTLLIMLFVCQAAAVVTEEGIPDDEAVRVTYAPGSQDQLSEPVQTVAKGSATASLCPNGLPLVSCVVAPCKYTKCPKHKPVCVDDYCGGCNFVCKEDEQPKEDPGGLCANGQPIANCLISPCKFNKCPSSTKCVEDYCGGCNYICEPNCPPGKPLVNCFVSPCKVNKCPSNTECVDDYCGGCNFNCKVKATTCPPGKPEVRCRRPPCSMVRCPAGTKCVNNYCGSCRATCEKFPK